MSPDAPAPTRAPVQARIAVVDVLRGAAMFGILAVNIWFFSSAAINAGLPETRFDGAADTIAHGAATLLFATKSYVLFAFLFGYSFVLQDGPEFVPRMRRRMAALLVIGLLHAVLLFPGDILVVYGLLGFVLLALRARPPRRAVRLGIALTALSGVAMLAVGGLVWWSAGAGAQTPPGLVDDIGNAYTSGIQDVVAQNARAYPPTLLFVLLLQGVPALGAMLCGMAAARTGLLGDPAAMQALWRRLTPWAPVVGVLGAVAFTWLSADGGSGPLLVAFGITILTAPLLTATYVAMLVVWQQRRPANRLLGGIAAVGRLALTNYLFQSLAMAVVFTGYGLRLMGQLSAVQTWAVVVVVFALQVVASTRWLRSRRYGPAEWLLRRWTRAGLRPPRTA